jgi:hypothetical protein
MQAGEGEGRGLSRNDSCLKLKQDYRPPFKVQNHKTRLSQTINKITQKAVVSSTEPAVTPVLTKIAQIGTRASRETKTKIQDRNNFLIESDKSKFGPDLNIQSCAGHEPAVTPVPKKPLTLI